MKWGSDGELSAVDLQGIIERLRAVDQQASNLMDCALESCAQASTAMQSISTRAPLGRAAACTQARAGATPWPNTSA